MKIREMPLPQSLSEGFENYWEYKNFDFLVEVFESKLSTFSKNYFPLHQSTYFVIAPYRQLKCHQHRIRSKTGISLEINLNVFKCLKVSLATLNFLLWQQYHFCLFQLASSMNLLWYQVCTFYGPLRKMRYYFPIIFLVLYLSCGCMTFDFTNTNDFESLFTPCR